MPRIARIVLPGIPYHITQRGVNRQTVFFTNGERQLYLTLIGRFAAKHGLKVLGYGLMPNHTHLIAIPEQESSLARAIGYTHLRYAQIINPLHDRVGHLWQARFSACPLDESHLIRALRYVERNPVRAQMVTTPWEYPWSSAAAHCGADDSSGLLDMHAWREQWPGDTWQRYLTEQDDADDIVSLRRWTNTGRPLGDEMFIERIETLLNRRLHPLPVGRPSKQQR